LVWFINRTLHLFGWALILEMEIDTDTVIRVYPARTTVRGFSYKSEQNGFIKLTSYLEKEATDLLKEAKEL
jgi:hypothetical protein